ncbi:MATE family efflux transporter [Zongyangia hominis]|uniref:Probable multidrug resistance protein NorM n=1 Tax=Zongyangia hominis TaxID=2763677 RepID=A0A926ECY3_9FIRM|nr:MATE family efflux transporter [Zongyangia hominis]MBC8569651.1 MATE family efflux transporter [Zongyangia hominis]
MANHKLLTEGSPFSTLLRFSLPFLLSNILQACYGASDLFMVGHFSDSIGVSAVATGGQVMQTITGLSIGLTAGGTVLIGRYFGAKERQNIAHAIKTMVIVFTLISLALTAGTILLLGPICSMMQVPAEAVETTRQYLLICASGILFIVGYNVVSGILRGLGDSRTPLILITVACIINVSTDLLFVGVMRWGAPGAAISTVLAQIISLVLAVFYLAFKGFLQKYRRSGPRFRLYAAKGVLSAGLPIALQEGLVNISFLVITAMINSLGLIASASVGVVEKLIVFSMLPTTAFSAALSAMTAQHHGAGLMERARRCLWIAIGLSLIFGLACLGLSQWDAPALVGLFTVDAQVIAQGALYLRSYSLDCVLVCFVFCMNAFLSGSGHSFFPLVHSLATTFLVRIPASYFLIHAKHPSMFHIGFAAPAASFLSMLLCQWYISKHYPEPRKAGKHGMSLSALSS